MIYELDELILINKMRNMSLSELYSLDVVKAVEGILNIEIDIEENTPAILVKALKVHAECFKDKITEAKNQLTKQNSIKRVG